MKKIILFITLLSPFIHSCSIQKNYVPGEYDASLLGTYSDNSGNLIYDSSTWYLLPDTCDTITRDIVIKSVTKKKDAYVIYASFNDTSLNRFGFVIISLKGRCKKCIKLEEKNLYTVRLIKYFSLEMWPDHSFLFPVTINNKSYVIPSNGWASNVYLSPDLIGDKIKSSDYIQQHNLATADNY